MAIIQCNLHLKEYISDITLGLLYSLSSHLLRPSYALLSPCGAQDW